MAVQRAAARTRSVNAGRVSAKLLAWALVALAALAILAAAGIAATWAPDLPRGALQARWAPPPSAFIEVGGQQVHYRDEGPRDDPAPIVLLHGTSSSLHTWEGWAAALRGTRRVVRFDLPGFGLTGPNASGDYSDAMYVRFALQMLDALKLTRVVLGGNSLGGGIAWETAVAAPGRVAQLILVDAAGYAFVPRSVPLGFQLARLPLLNPLTSRLLPRSAVQASVRNVYGHPERVTEELVDRYTAMTLREGNRRALTQRMAQIDRGENAALVATVRVPTLILWGGQDRLIPPENATRFAQDIAGSKLVIFDDLGHVPHEEDPQRTLAVVQRFLAAQR
jgi:pimeloyl-ACP methyl ester carboxylesterase